MRTSVLPGFISPNQQHPDRTPHGDLQVRLGQQSPDDGLFTSSDPFDDKPDVEIVRLHGLCARPELNGMFGIITGAMRADGRYPVQLYPEDRRVLVLAGNLTMMFGDDDDDYSYSHDEDSESDDGGDDHQSKPPRHADPVPPKPPPEPPPEPTSTPPRTVTHPRHILLTPDISRRLFADLWPSSSTLLPPSIADSTMAPQPKSVSEAVARQPAAARQTPTRAKTGTSRGHVKVNFTEAARKAAAIQAQHEHQCRLAKAESARVAEEARRKVMVQRAHQLGTGQPLRLPGSARDRMQAQEDKHARRRVKEDRRKASHARAAAELAAPVRAAAVALATAEAVPRQLMVGESGLAYRLSSRGEEPDWPGQPEGARASAREPLGTLWW